MDTTEIRDTLSRWAAGKPLVGRLWIFGSRARGDHRPESDIDVAIELDLSAAHGVDESGGLATWMSDTKGWDEELEALLPFEVDLEQFRGSDTPTIQKALQRSSILIYAKQS
jgi:predicted nucleotidyltransferase